MLNNLNNEEVRVIPRLFENLEAYCSLVKAYVLKAGSGAGDGERSKLHVNSGKYSHAEEVEERLDFL